MHLLLPRTRLAVFQQLQVTGFRWDGSRLEYYMVQVLPALSHASSASTESTGGSEAAGGVFRREIAGWSTAWFRSTDFPLACIFCLHRVGWTRPQLQVSGFAGLD
ncbi:hypothetical protein CLOM_g3012 [Closterium sp. NIES-68]|nr:hypothetical protein CLOM_g18656 [Closterium sp. NIES-68]GJP43564.1 hypothetical protein CLOM_g3012 [Closterium sp. NIES-68]GJP76984.1 hypothetical protein CLOP_g7422 [Closterium sp. NIES-67]